MNTADRIVERSASSKSDLSRSPSTKTYPKRSTVKIPLHIESKTTVPARSVSVSHPDGYEILQVICLLVVNFTRYEVVVLHSYLGIGSISCHAPS